MAHRTYRSRGRVYCMGSGTIPHPSDVRGELVRRRPFSAGAGFTRAWCHECHREVALLGNGCVSHHGPNRHCEACRPFEAP